MKFKSGPELINLIFVSFYDILFYFAMAYLTTDMRYVLLKSIYLQLITFTNLLYLSFELFLFAI